MSGTVCSSFCITVRNVFKLNTSKPLSETNDLRFDLNLEASVFFSVNGSKAPVVEGLKGQFSLTVI